MSYKCSSTKLKLCLDYSIPFFHLCTLYKTLLTFRPHSELAFSCTLNNIYIIPAFITRVIDVDIRKLCYFCVKISHLYIVPRVGYTWAGVVQEMTYNLVSVEVKVWNMMLLTLHV